MKFENIKYKVIDRVAWIKFNRPDQLNAMNRQMMEEIISALDLINRADHNKIAVGIITGEGRAFMAGADIKEYAQQTKDQFDAFQLRGRSLYASIEENIKPIIAAINGYAFGGGLEIALACDMVLTVPFAKMGLPEIQLSLIPGGGASQRLTNKVGANMAKELIMTGRVTTAEEMFQKGFVNHIFEKEVFYEEVEKFAQELAAKPGDRLSAIKKLIEKSTGRVSHSALDMEQNMLSKFYQSDDGQAKVQEFYQNSLKNK